MRTFTKLSLALASYAAVGLVHTSGAHAASTGTCSASSFASLLGTQAIPGAEVVNVEARELHKYESKAVTPHHQTATIDNACEVKVLYDNPGMNSTRVTVTTRFPLQREAWNGRFLGTGGGGWMCTMGEAALNEPLKNGFATSTTDGGLFGEPFVTEYTLITPGNPDKFKLERLGHRAIHDMTVAAKQVIGTFYGQLPSSSYYVGCSTGGRQGLMEAARYPNDYDGLLVGAPAAELNRFVVRLLADPAAMYKLGYFPTVCELEAIRQAAVERCDGLDGRTDGLVARQDLCKFSAQSAVGRTYADTCDGNGELKSVTSVAARFYQTVVDGAFTKSGRKIGAGFPWGTNITFPFGAGSTRLDPSTGKRTPVLMPFSRQFAEDYLYDGYLPADWSTLLTMEEIARLQDEGTRLYEGILEPSNDLTAFRQRGGKLLLFHGEQDGIIPVGNSLIKLNKIAEATFPGKIHADRLEALQEFLRYYILPGMAHCGPLPQTRGKVPVVGGQALKQLIAWVEAGQAPEELKTDGTTEKGFESVCRWPKLPQWTDNGRTLTCVEDSTSFFGRLPRLLEYPIQFLEILPNLLFLKTGRSDEL